MKKTLAMIAALGFCAAPALAAVGDWWILPIDRLDGSFTTHAGAGYDGTDAKQGNGMDGVRRVWWNTNNVHESSAGATFPTQAELFTVEAYGATAGNQDWMPIQAVYNGYGGDAFPIEANIPWAGQFGTNSQWLGSDGFANGAWNPTGPGPQAPASTDFNAAGNGTTMWMTGGSVLFAKWDFPWNINRSLSMIRITQVTPEPASALLLLLGAPLLLGRKRRA